MDTLRQDLIYALRRLAMAPAFTFVAIATLALGIGANSAIFSIVYAVLLKPLPFPEPDRLVQLFQVSEGRNVAYFSPPNFLDTQAAAKSFEAVAAVDGGGVTLTGHGAPAVLTGAEVSASFFNVFRVTPQLGRVIAADENEPEKATVVVLGHELWQGRFGGDPKIVGTSIRLDSLIALQPTGVKRLGEASIDRTVMLFAGGLAIFTGLLCGTFPGLSARRAPAQALREGGRGLLAGRGSRVRSGLVIGQMALAMMLLAGAGLLLKSFAQLQDVQPGFDSQSALTFRIALPAEAYKDETLRVAFFDRLMERLAALPGARAAAATLALPLGGSNMNISFEIRNRPSATPAQQPSMEMRAATPGYFKAMGIPLLRGRVIEPTDTATSNQIVIITQSAARKYFPNENPIGHWITMGWRRPEGKPKTGGEIVGIVGDVKTFGLSRDVVPEIYLPYAQLPVASMDVMVRTSVPPLSLGPAVERVVHELDRDLPVARLRTLDELVARSISQPRFYMLLLSLFASMAVLLAALGIFGVMSYAVTQRSREIGIRMALGAQPSSVMRMILRNAGGLIAAGIVVGLAGALALSRFLSGLLFHLSPTDPTTLAAVALTLIGVALLASYLPARQATRVDPLTTLRSE